MIKSELVARVAERRPDLAAKDVDAAVSAIFDEISDALVRGDRVELRGFGAFSVKDREARTARNPRTGEPVEVPAKRLPAFKPGKELRERLNKGSDPGDDD